MMSPSCYIEQVDQRYLKQYAVWYICLVGQFFSLQMGCLYRNYEVIFPLPAVSK